ncbi:hypothetical protein ACEWY4_019902 [Coilia grayii]|uniref:C-type lectin domain-containing protein n=1 Tax=Coilia grayii TaxID=363190 RepID=A0ABD1JC92_9TELE
MYPDTLASETGNMEDEVCYSSVSFVKSEEIKPREEQSVETQSEETVYTEVKKTGIQAEPSPSQTPADDGPLPGRPRCHRAVVALGLLTAALLSALVALVAYLQLRYEDASIANQRLHLKMVQLQQEKETLRMERDHLSMTLGVIFQFSDFPVDHYCPISGNSTQDRKCSRPCKEGWVYYQSSCYQFICSDDFYWEDSKNHCNKSGAHLVIIDTKEEQAFINNHTKFYYKEYGYWIGLQKTEDKWQWVNGSELIGGYWITNEKHKCAATMPSSDPLKSWKAKDCYYRYRLICEMEATVWPD